MKIINQNAWTIIKTLLEDLFPKYLCFSDPFVKDRRLKQYPMLHVDILQHVSVLATGILQQLEQQPSVLSELPTDAIKKLADRIGAPDCRYSLSFVITECRSIMVIT
jgi:hypothetical protein